MVMFLVCLSYAIKLERVLFFLFSSAVSQLIMDRIAVPLAGHGVGRFVLLGLSRGGNRRTKGGKKQTRKKKLTATKGGGMLGGFLFSIFPGSGHHPWTSPESDDANHASDDSW